MTKQMKCAKEIAKWLGKHYLHEDTLIYVDHKRYEVSEEGELVYDIDCEPSEYFEYYGDFLSLSTEGQFYNVLNFYDDFIEGYDEKRITEFNNILEKYGKYYELGNSWNLSLYSI